MSSTNKFCCEGMDLWRTWGEDTVAVENAEKEVEYWKYKITDLEHALNYHPNDSELTSKLEDARWRLNMTEETLQSQKNILDASTNNWESHKSCCEECNS